VRTAIASRDESEIFAANRAAGHIALVAGAARGRTRRIRVQEDGSLRVRFPNATPDALEAVLVNTAGGMTGGDRFSIDISLEPRASMVVGTAAAEKIYRSTGPAAEVAVKLDVGAGSRLVWLPQETILFDRANLSRRIEIDLADDASLLLCESVVFGRSAMGEAVAQGRFMDRWRLRRGGRLIFAETVRLDGAIDRKLAEAAAAAGAIAMATLLIVPGDDGMAATVRGLVATFRGEVGVSVWNGLALARFCARDGAALRHDLIGVLTALGRCSLPRLWLS
jgi:urease accessory protein